MPIVPNSSWSDWLHHQTTPCRRLVATSRTDLVTQLQALLDASPPDHPPRLKVLSSGHSTSDVGQPADVLVELERDVWHDDPQNDAWLLPTMGGGKPAWLPANAQVKRCNALLSARGLAFPNLGSYDKQSVFGAVCTGTHGTGHAIPALADIVLALDMVVVRPDASGKLRATSIRLEPADTPVTTAAYAAVTAQHPELPQVVRDTDLFRAAVVSNGLFGIVTGVVVKAVDTFWLSESRTTTYWASPNGARALIDPWAANEAEWLDLTITPTRVAEKPDDWGVLVTRRTRCAPGSFAYVRDDARTRAAITAFNLFGPDRNNVASKLAALNTVTPQAATETAWADFKKNVTSASNPPFVSTSNYVLFTSIGDYVAATSTEVHVPRAEWKAAVDTTLATLDALAKQGYHSLVPVGVRFGAASGQLMAPQVGRDTCTIEVGCLVGLTSILHPGTNSWTLIDTILKTVEAALVSKHHGRPHWGQRSYLDMAGVKPAYPAGTWDKWKVQRDKLDPKRLFDNAFSQRFGL
jgi:L-gulonolactone oxidase